MIRKKRSEIIIGLICMFIFMSFIIYKNKVDSMSNENTTETVSTSKLDEDLNPKIRSTSVELAKAASDSDKFAKLKIQLEDICKDNGVWSIYIKDLKSQEHLSINNEKMVAASVIKLFIMAKTYQEIDSGNIEKNTEVSELLRKMITISHNEASNKLVRILGSGSHKSGMKVINQFARSNDYLNTEQQRDMRDSRPVPVPEENYTSVEDCAKLLEEIYKNQCISPELDKEMMNLMLAQERNTKIPALIPKGIKIAHKTGELSKTENDVGIVFGKKTDYIICIMTKELKNTSEARKRISQISKVVYELLEK